MNDKFKRLLAMARSRRGIMGISIIACLAGIAAFLVFKSFLFGKEFAPQRIVDSFVELQPRLGEKQAKHLVEKGECPKGFDVNRYFKVLDALHLEEGLVLDWVYRREEDRKGVLVSGSPVVYIRRKDAPPYPSVEEYARISPKAFYDKARKALNADDSFFYGYIDKIHAEDSPEGFFQLIVMRLLGDRFYLYPREENVDIFLVCSKKAWKSIAKRAKTPEDLIAPAAELDFSPRISIGKDTVEASVTTYNSSRGIDLHKFAISRQYPHRISRHTRTNILKPEFRFKKGE